MKRKPVTLSKDTARLIEGAIAADVFPDRSTAVRQCLRQYFAANLVETAALIATNATLDVTTVATELGVDEQELRQLVAAIDPNRVSGTATSHLEAIESEFIDVTGAPDSSMDQSPSEDQ